MRPEWLVAVTEMWPSLPKGVSTRFIAWASKDEQRVDGRMASLPTRGVYSGSAEMTRWVEGDSKGGGVYDIIVRDFSALLKSPAEYYNVFYHLQVLSWEVTNPMVKSDFNKVKAVLFSMRTARVPLDESKFLAWVNSFRLLGQLRAFQVLGEREERKAKPSVLLAVRLWDWARKLGGVEETKSK